MADISQLSLPCILKRHLLQNCYSMNIFVDEMEISIVDDYAMPKLNELAGRDGAVRRLTNEEVGQTMVNDMTYKKQMQGKATAVGDLDTINDILGKALSMQGERAASSPTARARHRSRRPGSAAVPRPRARSRSRSGGWRSAPSRAGSGPRRCRRTG